MINDIWTVMRKEFRELLLGRGTARGSLGRMLIFLLILGVFTPYQMGKAWVQSPFVLFYALWFPLMVVSSIVADSFAGERERHTLETLLASRLSDTSILLGKVLSVVAYAWGMILGMLIVGMVTVNLTHGHGKLLIYPPAIGFGAVGLSLLMSFLSASVGVLISLKASTVRQAQQTLSYISIFVVIVPVIGIQILANVLSNATRAHIRIAVAHSTVAGLMPVAVAILLALNAIFFCIAASRFQRAKLILD